MKKKWYLIPLLCFVLVVILLRFVFYIGYIPTESMEPTIPVGSRIIGIRIFDELHTGDIIVFEYEGTKMVKRIAGCPGDVIRIQNKEFEIPKGCYYVLGDNYVNSYDSRYWSEPFLQKEKIIAILIFT